MLKQSFTPNCNSKDRKIGPSLGLETDYYRSVFDDVDSEKSVQKIFGGLIA